MAVALQVFPTESKKIHPFPSEKYVEHHCTIPIGLLLTPLSFSFILIVICAFYGYKTRKLPHNFNESKHIFIYICINLMLYVLFLPSFYAATNLYHKIMLMQMTLIISASAMLLCLFVPKVYAVYCVKASDMVFTGHETTHVTPQGQYSSGENNVGPTEPR